MISNEQLNSDRSKFPGNWITNITSASNLLQPFEDYNNVVVWMRITDVLLMLIYISCCNIRGLIALRFLLKCLGFIKNLALFSRHVFYPLSIQSDDRFTT